MNRLKVDKKVKLFSLLIVLAAIVCVCLIPNFSFGDEINRTNQNRKYNHTLDDFEKLAENERISRTDFIYEEQHQYYDDTKSRWDDCWGQSRYEQNVIHTNINGTDYPFKYNVTGFYGDKDGKWHRTGNVQFFYNFETKTLRILCFGDGSEGFNTYNYHANTSVLEDHIQIYLGYAYSWHQYDISQECRCIELDPKLEKIMHRGFRRMPYLEKVDIIGKKYTGSNLREIQNHAFDDCGSKNNNGGVVKMCMLNVKKYSKLDLDDSWHEDTEIKEAAFITGKILNVNGGTEAGITVDLETDGHLYNATKTQANGKFTFPSSPVDTTFQIHAYDNNGNQIWSEEFTLNNDTCLNTMQLKKVPEFDIMGSCESFDIGISYLPVELLDENGNVISTTVTDEFSNFKFTGIERMKVVMLRATYDGKTIVTDKILVNNNIYKDIIFDKIGS